MGHASEGKMPNEKQKGLERVCELLLRSKAKPLSPKQFKKFKSETWPKIAIRFAKKCLDAFSL